MYDTIKARDRLNPKKFVWSFNGSEVAYTSELISYTYFYILLLSNKNRVLLFKVLAI